MLFLRSNPAGQAYKRRLEQKHGKAKALTILAHKLGRAAFYMLKRKKAFDLNKFWKNPANAAREEAVRALNDVRKPMRPIGL